MATRKVSQSVPDMSRAGLYFVRAGNFVKIGRTTSFPQRLVSIQTGCPFKIDEAYHFAGLGRLERYLHRELASEAAHGEWFRWGNRTEARLNWIRMIAFQQVAAIAHLRECQTLAGD